ncbi:MAG: antibiotic biosynthesis monooxygenase [Proteobacteria bacterium]|nr:antibiotic biosynthesis monooxygenase [Pseudomonadota bacterium]
MFTTALPIGMPFAITSIMILVIKHMRVPAEKRKELSQTIASLIGAIKKEKGCGRCDFFQGIEDENILCLLEEWESRKTLETYLKSECYKVMRGAMNLLSDPCELVTYCYLKPPEIKKE